MTSSPEHSHAASSGGPPSTVRAPLPFAGLGGEQEATRWGPRSASLVVAIAPALGVRADYYAPLASTLVERGGGRLAVVTFDLPGHGKSPLRAARAAGRDWGYRDLLGHFAELRTAARRDGAARFVWLGHSLGGQVALMDAEHVDAVVLIASGAPYHRAWPRGRGTRILLATQLAAAIGRVVGHYPGDKLGFAGREARQLISEWAHVARTGRYVFGAFDAEAAMARAHVPIHSVAIEGDELAPEPAIDHTLALATLAQQSRTVWRRSDQGELARGNVHNRWPRYPEVPTDETLRFLERLGLWERGSGDPGAISDSSRRGQP